MAPLKGPTRPRRAEVGSRAAAGRFRAAVRDGRATAAAAAACLLVAGCASVPPLPQRPEPVPYADTLPIEEPASREPVPEAIYFEASVLSAASRPFQPRRWLGAGHEALDLTHFDDVVSSAWFEHRNGRTRLSPEAVGRGAATAPGPDTSATLTVVAGKAEGIQPGFTVRDARGDRYLLKFDPEAYPYVATAADVVVSRLLWAAGYHVPADYVVVFDADRLALDPGAEVAVDGRERPMTRADVEAILRRGTRREDGLHVALASRFVPGTPKGPFRFEGRRPDDPNDHYVHQHRRELRGLYVLCAWLNHVDMRYENTLDAWIDPPGYLRHYLLDFGSALGSGGLHPHYPREGLEHNFDLWPTVARLVTLGFYTEGWEGPPPPAIHPMLGWMPVESFRPGEWKANWPNGAFDAVTPADGYWGAKLVASFTDAQLEAAVDAAGLPDPAARDTLVDILAYRRDRTVEYWFGRVTPLEDPEMAGAAVSGGGSSGDAGGGFTLSFRDLALDRGLAPVAGRRYGWELLGGGGERLARGEAAARPGPAQRLRVEAPAAPLGDRPLELRVRAQPGGGRPARIFLRADGGAVRVVGLLH